MSSLGSCIITPTFQEHFQYIPTYLESYCRFVQDAQEIGVVFTISQEELAEFQTLISPFAGRAKIQVLVFEELLAAFQITETTSDLLRIYGRYSFQTLKKFYSMLYIDAERFLILDSESAWIRKCSMGEEFDRYFSHPFVTGSLLNHRERTDTLITYMTQYVDAVIGIPSDRWTLENFMWYVDRTILEDMFREIGSPYECIQKVYKIEHDYKRKPRGLMEALLYQNWLYLNRQKYNYRLLDVDAELSRYLPDENCGHYRKCFIERFNGACGYLEHAMECVDRNTVYGVAKLFADNDIRIVRCQSTSDYERYRIQKKFLRRVKPCILACSQDHAFLDRHAGHRLAVRYYKDWIRAKLPEKVWRIAAKILKKFCGYFKW